MLFSVKNPHIYQSNTSVRGMNTRQQNKLHITSVKFPQCREVFITHPLRYSNTFHKIYINHNLHIFKILLRDLLVKNAFYYCGIFFY